jgi:hypothetical protein
MAGDINRLVHRLFGSTLIDLAGHDWVNRQRPSTRTRSPGEVRRLAVLEALPGDMRRKCRAHTSWAAPIRSWPHTRKIHPTMQSKSAASTHRPASP